MQRINSDISIGTLLVIALSLVLILCASEPALSLELRSYYIDCDDDEFNYIITHPEESPYIDCVFEYNDRLWRNVRIRLRGETSREYPKKSFKVNFDADNRFFDRDKLNLISCWMDATFSREYLAYDFYRRAGLPASGAWWVRLYINNRYIGLYLDVEQVDEHFLRATDLPNDGTIYKADINGCLLRPSDRIDQVWGKKTNLETGNYDLLGLISWLDNTPDLDFFEELPDHFDPEELARVIAVNGIMANTSTYYHNYYLIHNLNEGGLWQMLPWDMDATYYFRYDFGVPHIYECGHPRIGTNKLIVQCWRSPEMRNLIYDQMLGIVDSIFTQEYYQAMADSIIDLLYDAVDEDTLKQYSTDQFVHDVNVYPEIGAGRGARVREKTAEYPVPFDLKTAVLTPTGVFFSWDETHSPNGDDLTYHIWISHNESFPPDDLVTIDYINETYLMYDNINPGQYFWRVNAVSENGKRTYCLSYNSPLVIPHSPFDATVVTGTIENSTTWNIDHSPYSLPEGITIAPGAVLTIEPGVLIGIGDWQDIRIEGGLVANGTMTDSVRFVPLNPNRIWRSFDIVDPSHPVQFIYTVIDGGYYFIRSNGGTLDIYDSNLRRGRRAVETFNTDVHMERCQVENFTEEVVATRESVSIVRSCHFSHGPWNHESSDLVDFDDLEGLEVNRCFFHVGFDDGIDLDRVRNARIINNRVENAGDKGISVAGWRCNNYIANNIITNCTKGIRSSSASGVQLYNNVIAYCDTGLQVGPYEGSGHVYARNNVLWRNDHQIDVLEDSELDIAYCMIQDDTLYPGDGNLCSDAHFIDQWNNNFLLREDSPLIDAGYGTGHPPTDYYEACRVDIPDKDNTGAGGIPYVDIGAFEYGSVGNVDENTPAQPISHLIVENYPNPFNSLTRIEYNVIGLSNVMLEIFDITGRHVFERRFEHAGPGRHSILWGGRNNDGLRLASGVYICRISQTAGVKSVKMVMVK